jgi:hypothetical protein
MLERYKVDAVKFLFVAMCSTFLFATVACTQDVGDIEVFDPITYEPEESDQNHVLDDILTSEPYDTIQVPKTD